MIRVFVVAPTPMMQAGLRAMLAAPEMQVSGETSTVGEVVAELPGIDVIVVEETLLEDVERAVANNMNGTVALVVLTNNGERLLPALRALSLRGWSVVPTDATTAQLHASVVAAAQGLITLPVAFADRLFEPRPVVGTVGTLEEPLTVREHEVLELVSQGLSNKLIARRLQISEHTVKFHISSISTKLGASSRTEAVSRGVRRGLITL